MNDPLVRRTVNQLSRQTDVTTGVTKHRSQTSFDATTAMPRRESPEETASRRPAWDSRASSRDRPNGGGAQLCANQNSFADAAAMRRDPSPARAAFATKTGDRAAAFGATVTSRHGPNGQSAYVTGRLSPEMSSFSLSRESPGSSGRASPSSPYPDAYPSPRGFGPKDDRYDERYDGSAFESSN